MRSVPIIYDEKIHEIMGINIFKAMINFAKNDVEKGYAPLHVKENFENCYKQYHILGANGFMDKLREEFLELPIQKS